MTAARIAIIGAPLDLGQGRRGVDMGPSALRVAGLGERLRALGYKAEDLGNVTVAQAENIADAGPANARFVDAIAESCSALASMVEGALTTGAVPLVLGGDHSIAVGTVAGVSRYMWGRPPGQPPDAHVRPAGARKFGILWIDAHADMNTPESSPSGNVHGMPLACCAGVGPDVLVNLAGHAPMIDPRNIVLVGLRDVDQLERGAVKNLGVHAFTMRDIDERGMRAVMEEAISLAGSETDGIHLSLDMDVVDPEYAPGVGTPVRGGVTYREAHLAMEMIGDSGRMISMEVVEVNPVLDTLNRTAELAVELTLSAMGKRIL